MLMSQLDARASTPALNARVRKALQKTVAKIEKYQQPDGSWNIAGGWAPILGTSLASRSLYEASKKGVTVNRDVLARADAYTVQNQKSGGSMSPGSGMGPGSSTASVVVLDRTASTSAGVSLYRD